MTDDIDVSRASSVKRTTPRLQSSSAPHRASSVSPAPVSAKSRPSLDSSTSDPSRPTENDIVQVTDEPSANASEDARKSELGTKDSGLVLGTGLGSENPSSLLVRSGLQDLGSSEALEEDAYVPLDPAESKSARLQADLALAREEMSKLELQRQEDSTEYLERIDALQSKLQYVAKEVLSSVKQLASGAPSGSLEQKVFEKDEKIILLMEEGQKLSKTEVSQSATIRSLRAKIAEDSKVLSDIKTKLTNTERNSREVVAKVARLENERKEAQVKYARLPRLQKEIADLRGDKALLQQQLEEARQEADEEQQKADAEALAIERRRVQVFEDEILEIRSELKGNDERAQEVQRNLENDLNQERERNRGVESSLRHEISVRTWRLVSFTTR